MKYKWSKGNKGRFWEPEIYKNLPYVKKPVFTEDGRAALPNSHGWMYDNSNPMPEFIMHFENAFNLKNQTYTFYKMRPGEIMTTHTDHYETYMKVFGAKYENICRVLVMLEDWKPGHYLEIDGRGIVNWVAGDYFIWESGCPHAAANIGVEDRYTLQITGEKRSSFNDWAVLHYFNVPGLPEKTESKNYAVKRAFSTVSEKNKPTYIYCYNQNITELEEITHEPSVVEYLNEEGINFYLYEPLCSYSPSQKSMAMSFYSEFKHKNFPTQREIFSNIKSSELDSIAKYAKRNNLTNITVHTGDYEADKVYESKYAPLKIVTDDIFLKISPNFPKLTAEESAGEFTKKFISLNWRYTKHRHMVAAYLCQMDANLTWYYKADIGVILYNESWVDAPSWKNSNANQYEKFCTGIGILNSNSPYNLDCDIEEPTLVTGPTNIHANPDVSTYQFQHPLDPTANLKKQPIEKFYNDSFCDIVTESRFAQPTGNYSEKTYQPMYYMKPFVLVAPPKTLQYLKEQGFKTFSDFWDESYDDYYNHHIRMTKIFDVIDYINSKSIEELKEMYAQMKDILEHNKALFLTKIKP